MTTPRVLRCVMLALVAWQTASCRRSESQADGTQDSIPSGEYSVTEDGVTNSKAASPIKSPYIQLPSIDELPADAVTAAALIGEIRKHPELRRILESEMRESPRTNTISNEDLQSIMEILYSVDGFIPSPFPLEMVRFKHFVVIIATGRKEGFGLTVTIVGTAGHRWLLLDAKRG